MWSLCQAEGYWKGLIVVAQLDETTTTFQKKSENLQVKYCFKNCVCMHDWPGEELRSRAVSFLLSDVKMHNLNRVSNAELCKWEKDGNREEAPFANKLELENNPRNDVIGACESFFVNSLLVCVVTSFFSQPWLKLHLKLVDILLHFSQSKAVEIKPMH